MAKKFVEGLLTGDDTMEFGGVTFRVGDATFAQEKTMTSEKEEYETETEISEESIQEFCAMMRRHGIRRMRLEGLDIELEPRAITPYGVGE